MAFTASKRFQKTVRQAGVYGGLAFFLFIMLFPFYWMFITSIKPNAEIYNLAQFPLIVKQPTLEHYGYLLTEHALPGLAEEQPAGRNRGDSRIAHGRDDGSLRTGAAQIPWRAGHRRDDFRLVFDSTGAALSAAGLRRPQSGALRQADCTYAHLSKLS